TSGSSACIDGIAGTAGDSTPAPYRTGVPGWSPRLRVCYGARGPNGAERRQNRGRSRFMAIAGRKEGGGCMRIVKRVLGLVVLFVVLFVVLLAGGIMLNRLPI